MKVLSGRLNALINMVTPGNRVCDVGCDHGFVSIELIRRGISPYALAMDVNEGPLKRAMEHVAEYGVSEKVELRLSNGLERYNIGEADTLLIAGMGGQLIIDILSQNINNTRDFKELILSPQSDISKVRYFLADNGYCFVDEILIFDEGKYYTIMKLKPLSELRDEEREMVLDKSLGLADGYKISRVMLKPAEALYGPRLIEKREASFVDYLKLEMGKKIKIMEILKTQEQTTEILLRISELDEEIRVLKEIIGDKGGITNGETFN